MFDFLKTKPDLHIRKLIHKLSKSIEKHDKWIDKITQSAVRGGAGSGSGRSITEDNQEGLKKIRNRQYKHFEKYAELHPQEFSAVMKDKKYAEELRRIKERLVV